MIEGLCTIRRGQKRHSVGGANSWHVYFRADTCRSQHPVAPFVSGPATGITGQFLSFTVTGLNDRLTLANQTFICLSSKLNISGH